MAASRYRTVDRLTLADDIHSCKRCPLSEQQGGHSPVAPYVGKRYGRKGIAVICDFPRYYDSKAGQPLKGKDGALFDRLAKSAGMERGMFFITDSVRCKPPNNRIDDYPEAINACGQWTQDEFALYDPAVVVLMGRVALRQVFGAEATVAATRGSLAATPAKHPWGQRLLVATYHPAAATFGGGEQSEVGQFIVQDLRAAMTAWRALRRAV